MDSGEHWSKTNQPTGWNICRGFKETLKKAHLKRHPNHGSASLSLPRMTQILTTIMKWRSFRTKSSFLKLRRLPCEFRNDIAD